MDRRIIISSQKWGYWVARQSCKGCLHYYNGTRAPAELELQGYCAKKVGPEGEEVFWMQQGYKHYFGLLF